MTTRLFRASVLVFAAALSWGWTVPAGSSADPPPTHVRRRPSVVVPRDDLRSVFDQAGVHGTFALLDVGANRLVVVDRARAERRAVPASTFKIAHSLIALETGVVSDVDEVVPYGGAPQPFAAWEHDMSIREAVPASNAAIFQELARRIGLEREQESLIRLGYGNQQVGSVVDRFWLDGPLAISPTEQVRFLARLAQRGLPVSTATQDVVVEILELERTADFTLYGKTGWQFDAALPQLGWWVGWVESPKGISSFALNIDMAGPPDASKRVQLGRELLRRLHVLP